ncbi:hypothetical protein R83H12_00441 [Fibrobacteria bacterium R8-3-H12]
MIIELLFSNACDRHCSYCVAKSKDKSYKGLQQKNNEQGDYKLESGIINIVQAKKWLLAQKSKWEDIHLVISGGEPTLLRHYTEFLDWCNENGFKPPILYTNGRNLKDLANCRHDPKNSVKVLLTHHLSSKPEETRDCVNFLKDMNVPFIVKLLTDGEDKREFGESLKCRYVVEGIKKLYSEDESEMIRQATMHNALSGESPFKWRWNGYGDLIDRGRTPVREAAILTVDPTGIVFNCHLFNAPLGSIYETDKDFHGLQMALCFYPDSFDGKSLKGADTRCETIHYFNLFESLKNQTEDIA